MAGWVGMNLMQCRGSSEKLGAQIKSLQGILNNLDTEVTTIDKSWNGDDSVLFVNNWRNKDRAEVQDAIRFLTDMKTKLDAEIAEQARASR
ncbi:MAG: hypothetical protein IPN45_04175 [Actinomycetales bacterium]|nr:hypothetical protein [Actinomycetales bacterium]